MRPFSLGAMEERNASLNPFQKLRLLIREAKTIFREQGFKGVLRRFGWKLFAVIFVYYLVRDVTLYILLPWYLATKFL